MTDQTTDHTDQITVDLLRQFAKQEGQPGDGIAFGPVMAALRLVTGSTWAAISYHAFQHIIWRTAGAFGLDDVGQVPAWLNLLQPAGELVVGVGLLWWWQRSRVVAEPARAID